MAEIQSQAAGAISGPNKIQNAGQYAASRESAQTIVRNMVKHHAQELAGWNYLDRVMRGTPPEGVAEAALCEIICRARRERY